MKFFAILAVLILSSPQSFAINCPQIFTSLGIYNGKPVNNLNNEKYTVLSEIGQDKIKSAHILGSGNFGTVFKIELKNGEVFTAKQYRNRQDALHDFQGLQILKTIILNNQIALKVASPDFIKGSGSALRLPYYTGKDVLKTVESFSVRQKKKQEITKHYNLLIEELFKALQSSLPNGRLVKLNLRGFDVIRFSPPDELPAPSLLIKPDNVLITNKGEFVIIDPH